VGILRICCCVLLVQGAMLHGTQASQGDAASWFPGGKEDWVCGVMSISGEIGFISNTDLQWRWLKK